MFVLYTQAPEGPAYLGAPWVTLNVGQWRGRFCSLQVAHRPNRREVQKTVDENAEKTRKAIDDQERGALTP
jgi:hypothetical protein